MAKTFANTKGAAQKDKAPRFTPKMGENRIRLFGPVIPRYVYWVKGENNKSIPVECLAFNRETETFDNAEPDIVKEFYPDMKCGWAYAMMCLDLNNPDEEPVLFDLKKKLFGQIIDLAEQLEADPTDPETGFDVVFEKKKTGPLDINVEYTVKQLKCKQRPLTDEERQKIESAKSIEEIMPRPTPDQQRQFLQRLQAGPSENVDESIEEELQAR